MKPAMFALALAVIGTQPAAERPTTIRVFTTRAIATVLDETGPEFERATGHTLAVTTDVAVRMVRRIQAGEPFDFLVAAPEQIDGLIREGRIVPETRTNLARSGIGVEVRAGAPKPDISSVEAFTRALLDAKSIAYLREGQSGVYLAAMIEQLGLTKALESKVRRLDTDIVSELVAQGQVELGMVVVTQILTTRGVALVGPLPPPLQLPIVFTAGVSTSSPASDAAKALMTFLTGSSAVTAMRSQGLEPGFDGPR